MTVQMKTLSARILALPTPAERRARFNEIAQAARLRVDSAKLIRLAADMRTKAIILERRGR